MNTEEKLIRNRLLAQGIQLRPGKYRIYNHVAGLDFTGNPAPGPHLVGRLDVVDRGELVVKIAATSHGRDATALLQDGLLEVTYDGAIRLIP